MNGNAYGEYAAIQAKFQMIAMAPMGPGLLVLLPAFKKFGRRNTIVFGSVLTMIGSAIAFVGAGNTEMVYGGSAISAMGAMTFMYSLMTFVGDGIDHVEYSRGVRCEGFTAALVGFAEQFSKGLGQGLFNLGLVATHYMTPEKIGVNAEGVALYADQTKAATNWINFSYQGAFLCLGVIFFVLFTFFFNIDKEMPKVHDFLQQKKKDECAAMGIEYIPQRELERREKEAQKAEAEENRVKELKRYCEKTGKNFDELNQKYLDKQAKKYAQDLLDFGANAVTLNTGGILASYDTDLEYHRKSDYLHGDSLGEVIEACHNAGIKVIARMDFSKVRYEVYEKHPEWAYRKADGSIVNYNGDVHVCPNSEFQQEYALEIVKEALGRFPFDGVFCNMSGFLVVDYSGTYHGPCHCENCRKKFHEEYGAEIPEKDDPRNPDYKKYVRFKAECTKKQKMNLHRTIRSISPGIAIDGVDYVRIESNTEIGVEKWMYSASSNARKIVGPEHDRMVDGAAVDFMGFRYRDTSVSPAQMELRQWQNLANGGSTSLYIMGRLDNHRDVSCFAGTRKVFQFLKNHEELYTGTRSAAEVMLIHKNLLARFDKETDGWIRALTESHIPFDEIRQSELKDVGQLAGKKVAILCDAKFLNEEQANLLDTFAEQGGSVLVTGDTGALYAAGGLRETFPLKCMGVKRLTEKKKGLMSSVFVVGETDKDAFPHCIEAPYIAFGEELVTAEFEEGTEKYLRMIPEYPFGPPERCYYTEVTDYPGVTVYPYGKGRGVYLPWMAGTFYFEEGYQNTLNLMQDVLIQLCGAVQIAPELSPMVEVTLQKKENRTIEQLVNTSGCFGNSFFSPVPMQDIRIELPACTGTESVKAYNGGQVQWSREGEKTVLRLNRLEAYEIITIA